MLAGKFRIVRALGRGGFGTVHEAQDEQLERRVAIKTFHPDQLEGAQGIFEQRFLREARSAARLIHPNIITIFEAGSDDGIWYIAMELVEGQTLRAILDQGRLPPARVGEIGIALAGALHYAHAQGIVHRDVKPENLMVRDDGQLKLTDFGIAKLLHDASQTLSDRGTVMGTPSYMSPEQVMEREVDGRSDLFSAGAVLYEALTATRPFHGSTMPGTIYKILHELPPPPHQVFADVPSELSAIVMRALAKDPGARFADCGGLKRALEGAPLDEVDTTDWTSQQSLAAAMLEETYEDAEEEPQADPEGASAPDGESEAVVVDTARQAPPAPSAASDQVRMRLQQRCIDRLSATLLVPDRLRKRRGDPPPPLVQLGLLARAGQADVVLEAVGRRFEYLEEHPDAPVEMAARNQSKSPRVFKPTWVESWDDILRGLWIMSRVSPARVRPWGHWAVSTVLKQFMRGGGLASHSRLGARLFSLHVSPTIEAILRLAPDEDRSRGEACLDPFVNDRVFEATGLCPSLVGRAKGLGAWKESRRIRASEQAGLLHALLTAAESSEARRKPAHHLAVSGLNPLAEGDALHAAAEVAAGPSVRTRPPVSAESHLLVGALLRASRALDDPSP